MASLHDPAGAAPKRRKLSASSSSEEDEEMLAANAAEAAAMQMEYHEPAERLRRHGVWNTIMVFGSARSKSRTQYDATLADLTARVAAHPGDAKELAALTRLKRTEWMCPFYEEGEKLGRLMAAWGSKRAVTGQPRYSVCTGGGPGMMEAVNKGAASVEGAYSIGMAIKLPFEHGLNKYVTPSLAFNFHYFFTRKLWMSLPCEALVVAPGGFGTCDELFELMTLIQCGKADKMPVVLLGGSYWKKVINWQAMVEAGTVSATDVDALFFCETAEEATEHIIERLEANEKAGVVGAVGELKW